MRLSAHSCLLHPLLGEMVIWVELRKIVKLHILVDLEKMQQVNHLNPQFLNAGWTFESHR